MKCSSVISVPVFLLISSFGEAIAGQIGPGDFGPSATTTDFNNLGLPAKAPSPQVINGHSFISTTDDETFSYLSPDITGVPEENGEILGVLNNERVQRLRIALDGTQLKAGLYVTGLDPSGWTIQVQFWGGIVGSSAESVNVSGSGPELVYAGLQWTYGIKSITVRNISSGSSTEAYIDDLTVEAIPEPNTLYLMCLAGFALLCRSQSHFPIRAM